MMNDMFKLYAKDLLKKALAAGGEKVLEELCENYDADELDKIIGILSRVRNKKRHSVHVEATVVK
jgi:hypothetical protein